MRHEPVLSCEHAVPSHILCNKPRSSIFLFCFRGAIKNIFTHYVFLSLPLSQGSLSSRLGRANTTGTFASSMDGEAKSNPLYESDDEGDPRIDALYDLMDADGDGTKYLSR